MKPIHKLNNGTGATLCNNCNCVISLGHTNYLYCKECKKELIKTNKIMKLQLTTYRKQYTIETENDDLTIEDYFEYFIGLLSSSGFHPDTINEHIIELSNEIKEQQDA